MSQPSVNEQNSNSSNICGSNYVTGSVNTPPLKCIQHLLELSMTNPTPKLFKFIRDELGAKYYEYFMEETALSHIMKYKRIKQVVSRWSLVDSPLYKLEHWTEAFFLPDEEFWKTFHVSKTTFNFVRKKVNTDILQNYKFEDGDEFDELVMKIILLSIWYLRNDATINECARIFDIPLEEIDDNLERGFALILKINNYLPPINSYDIEETGEFFEEYSYYSIVGVLGFHLFKTEAGQEIMAQFVCDHKYQFMSYDTCFHSNVCRALTESEPLQDFLNLVPDGSFLAAFKEYGKYPGNILKISAAGDDEDAVIVNKTLSQALTMAHLALMKLIVRFPRLSKLHKQMPYAIMAGFTLHNLCLINKDAAPLV